MDRSEQPVASNACCVNCVCQCNLDETIEFVRNAYTAFNSTWIGIALDGTIHALAPRGANAPDAGLA